MPLQFGSSYCFSDFRLWARHFAGPIYLPPEGRSILTHLRSNGPLAFLDVLQRFADIGSPWAAATLAYIHLYPSRGPRRNPERAISVCERTAQAGDAYSQFVLAWALRLSGRKSRAIAWMKSASVQQFPPAALDLTRFVWNGWGLTAADPWGAVRMLKYAKSLHHRGTLSLRCAYFKTGRLGWPWTLIGNCVAPIAVIRHGTGLLLDPFSAENLLFDPQADYALLKSCACHSDRGL